ncbi:MAG: type II toxin-antitoxin system RelE/ParE family toxin [Leptospiraceae bacterium]|nr:type II toxin-antitoxin system RelE/ParE family toxin [Leptospiraceae bacterium]
MIRNFANRATEELWETNTCKNFPREIWIRAKALLTIMHSTSTLNDLKIKGQPPNIRLHKLKGNRKLEWSITINLPWCITFQFKDGEFLDVKIENYHRG